MDVNTKEAYVVLEKFPRKYWMLSCPLGHSPCNFKPNLQVEYETNKRTNTQNQTKSLLSVGIALSVFTMTILTTKKKKKVNRLGKNPSSLPPPKKKPKTSNFFQLAT